MYPLPFVDIHTHMGHDESETVTVQNFHPGEEFPAFFGRNFFSVGLHPWNLKSENENNFMLQLVREVMEYDHVIFVGECGLDKKVVGNFSEQERIFEAHARIADEVEKPLIIHCVRAYNEVVSLHKKIMPKVPWIFHGYNGSIDLTRRLADHNFMFSFGKFLFYPGSNAVESFNYLPLSKIFLETDESNCHVRKFYAQAASLKGIGIDELIKATIENFNRLENINKNRDIIPALEWLKKLFLHDFK